MWNFCVLLQIYVELSTVFVTCSDFSIKKDTKQLNVSGWNVFHAINTYLLNLHIFIEASLERDEIDQQKLYCK